MIKKVDLHLLVVLILLKLGHAQNQYTYYQNSIYHPLKHFVYKIINFQFKDLILIIVLLHVHQMCLFDFIML